MRTCLFTLLLLTVTSVSRLYAQIGDPQGVHKLHKAIKDTAFAEHGTHFPGGPDSLFAFMQRTIKYPKQGLKKKYQGRVFVEFVVDSAGTLNNVQVVRSLNAPPRIQNVFNKEAVRAVKAMPRWLAPTLGTGKDKAKVSEVMVLPVEFSLEKRRYADGN
ncbi:MAG: energy transducer TonB [Bacteroidota bacterium]